MPRLLPLLILLSVISPGCGSDRDAQLEVAFPRVVEIENGSQDRIDLRAPLMVGFFLGGLVTHGGVQACQQWRRLLYTDFSILA